LRNSIAIIIAILVLVISFLSFTNAPFVARSYSTVKSGLGSVFGPVLSVASKPVSAVGGFFDSYFNRVGSKKENEELGRNTRTSTSRTEVVETERENARLRKLLDFTQKRPKHDDSEPRVFGET
jgi:cell shape-determining protein MreC